MIYTSKKDPKVTASFDFEDTKCNTTRLIYLTGEKAGTSFVVSNSTLKRWWTKESSSPIEVDMEEVNKPYKPDVTPHYIPKPQSVIEYEENKRVKNKVDFTMPSSYEEFGDLLAEKGVIIKKVNSGYISLPDSTKIKLLRTSIGILASTEIAERFVKRGFKSKPCIEKGTPFRFDITTQKEYDMMLEALSE